MYIGHIAGFAFLPVSVVLFLNIFGVTDINSIFGISLILLAAIGLVIIQIGDIVDSHLKGEYIILYWVAGVVLCLPGLLFLFSKAIVIPSSISAQLPLIIACFLFTEGVSSFFIGN